MSLSKDKVWNFSKNWYFFMKKMRAFLMELNCSQSILCKCKICTVVWETVIRNQTFEKFVILKLSVIINVLK